MREFTSRDLAYEKLAPRWRDVISEYDTRRRLAVLIDEFLGAAGISSKTCLDGGCGLGYFSQALASCAPAALTAVDIAPSLVASLKARSPAAECIAADLLQLDSVLGNRTFDVVVSSEVIEHTPDPALAVAQLCARVGPGGVLVLSCPNRRWKWLLSATQAAGLRKHYEGYENWVRPRDLLRWIEAAGLRVVRAEGIHTVPWHVSEKLVRRLDGCLRHRNYSWAVNLAVMAQR